MRAVVLAGVCVLALFLAGCATTSAGIATPADVADRIEKQAGYRTREVLTEPSLPSGVSLDDGLTEDEAVAIALWNNPGFQESVADLGIARAELVQAGLLRNPVFTLLLPWGPKQLEATAKFPFEAIWQRPQRVAAARVAADAVAERLVATGLNLVANSRLAVVDLMSAEAHVQLAADTAQLGRRIAELSRSRFQAGDISELEVNTFDTEASQAAEVARRATVQVVLAQNGLHQILGLGDLVRPEVVKLTEGRALSSSCNEITALERDALASRPDLRAAELEIEAAGRRLGWERSRIFSFLGVLDANSQGKEGFELGPGLETDFGLFDRNQAGVIRAGADLDRARARYQTTRQQILRDVQDAYGQLASAIASAQVWRENIRPMLERQVEQTERAYRDGELSFLAVLDALRRLNTGRTSELDADVVARQALVRLEHSIGRRCSPQLETTP